MSINDLCGANLPEADLTEASFRGTVVKSAQSKQPMTGKNEHLS
jgi:uncharacterized protein YjbI with pentapeptide repeats